MRTLRGLPHLLGVVSFAVALVGCSSTPRSGSSPAGVSQPVPTPQPRATAAPSGPQAADFEILYFRTERDARRQVRIVGEIQNNGALAAGAELQAIARDDEGKIVTSTTFWPASTRNIEAGGTSPIGYVLTGSEASTAVELKVVSARVWR